MYIPFLSFWCTLFLFLSVYLRPFSPEYWIPRFPFGTNEIPRDASRKSSWIPFQYAIPQCLMQFNLAFFFFIFNEKIFINSNIYEHQSLVSHGLLKINLKTFTLEFFVFLFCFLLHNFPNDKKNILHVLTFFYSFLMVKNFFDIPNIFVQIVKHHKIWTSWKIVSPILVGFKKFPSWKCQKVGEPSWQSRASKYSRKYLFHTYICTVHILKLYSSTRGIRINQTEVRNGKN